VDVNSDTLEVLACLQVKRILSQAQEHGLENPKAILCASKRISTAIEAYEHLNNLFASDEWIRGHAAKTVGQYVTLWRDSLSIERPRTNVDHGCCEDIRESRSFLATSSSGKGIVLMRKWDCWCDACLQISGRGEGNMSGRHCPTMNRKLSQLEVQGCVGPGQGLKNVFDERQVKPLPKGSTQERVEAEHFGRELVLKGKVGDFVGIQNRAEDEDDTFWVAQLVDSQQGNKAHPHIYERVTERHKQIEHEGVKVGLNRGEYAFTVRFLERDASDPNRMTFLPPSGPVRLVNSSELRAIKLKMDQATVMLDMPKRRSGSKAAHVVKDRLILTGESENEILRRCY
jgi:hypothetical protein